MTGTLSIGSTKARESMSASSRMEGLVAEPGEECGTMQRNLRRFRFDLKEIAEAASSFRSGDSPCAQRPSTPSSSSGEQSMLSSRPTIRMPRPSSGPRRRSTSAASKTGVSLNYEIVLNQWQRREASSDILAFSGKLTPLASVRVGVSSPLYPWRGSTFGTRLAA
jgi:hypothetical protein